MEYFDSVVEHCSSTLTSLSLLVTHNNKLQHKFDEVRTLNLMLNTYDCDESWLHLSCWFPKLQKLTMNYPCWNVRNRCSLRKLRVSTLEEVTFTITDNSILADILNANPQITSLTIVSSTGNDVFESKVKWHRMSISTLDIARFKVTSDWISKLRNLKTLIIDSESGIKVPIKQSIDHLIM